MSPFQGDKILFRLSCTLYAYLMFQKMYSTLPPCCYLHGYGCTLSVLTHCFAHQVDLGPAIN